MTAWDDFRAGTNDMTKDERHDRAWYYLQGLVESGIYYLPENILLAIEQKIFEDEDD